MQHSGKHASVPALLKCVAGIEFKVAIFCFARFFNKYSVQMIWKSPQRVFYSHNDHNVLGNGVSGTHYMTLNHTPGSICDKIQP